MRLTHYGHSCVLVELGDARILIDPGNLSAGFEQLTGLDAILVTHQHPDHGDVARLPALLAANPQAAAYCDPQSAQLWAGEAWGARFTAARTGDAFHIADVRVDVAGGTHATIHPDIPLVDNACFLFSTPQQAHAFLHPGDALFVPDQPVDVLALPATAPWSKLQETVDYFRAVAPRVAIPIHTAIVSEPGLGIYLGQLQNLGPSGTRFLTPPREEAVEIPLP
ncbi:MBL fold metallo-hydrolase [Tomitella gaofuii]|uniref:MBL fold metallo-hydrolase n=1 Tax=Tomitella gaofuii TaxID=2760083 RepID=UPI0015FB0C35|nr:MBL fold metallo-hydrolase [Tomitella gaofuii]